MGGEALMQRLPQISCPLLPTIARFQLKDISSQEVLKIISLAFDMSARL